MSFPKQELGNETFMFQGNTQNHKMYIRLPAFRAGAAEWLTFKRAHVKEKGSLKGGSIMETQADFVARLSKDVVCYYHRLKQSGLYPLKRNNTMQRGQMDVFGFVLELKDRFRIHCSEKAVKRAGVLNLFDGTRERLWWRETGAYIYVRKGSSGEDYQRAVDALKAIKNLRNER